MKIVTVKMPEYLVLVIDTIWRKLGYSSRGEFIRDAVRHYINHLMKEGVVKPDELPSVLRSERGNIKIVKVVEVEE